MKTITKIQVGENEKKQFCQKCGAELNDPWYCESCDWQIDATKLQMPKLSARELIEGYEMGIN